MADRPTFTVLEGDSEPVEVGSLIPDRTANYVVHTFGELFADIAWQVRRNTDNERAALLHRLNDCAEAYGHIPLPDDEAGQGPTAVAPSAPSSPRQEG